MPDSKTLYRKYLRFLKTNNNPALENIGKHLQADCLNLSISEKKILHFDVDLEGFIVHTNEGRAFLPKKQPTIPTETPIIKKDPTIGMLFSVNLLIPSLASNKRVSELHSKLAAANGTTETDQIISNFYSVEYIHALFERMLEIPIVNKYSQQLLESLAAYGIGLHLLAITGMLPCIEGIIRDLQTSLNLKPKQTVRKRDLIEIINKSQKKIILDYIFEGAWIPHELKSIELYQGKHAWIDRLDELKLYIDERLYLDTQSPDATLFSLNRHGILHGFTTGFGQPSNYGRLVSVLETLYICATLAAGSPGSFLPPEVYEENELFAFKIRAIQAIYNA